MFCCKLLYVHSSIAIILLGKRELVALLNLSSWCLMMVEQLFLAVPRGCLRFVIVIISDRTHLLFFKPSSKIFYGPFQGGLFCRSFSFFFCLVLAMPFMRVWLYVPCGHLLGKS